MQNLDRLYKAKMLGALVELNDAHGVMCWCVLSCLTRRQMSHTVCSMVINDVMLQDTSGSGTLQTFQTGRIYAGPATLTFHFAGSNSDASLTALEPEYSAVPCNKRSVCSES